MELILLIPISHVLPSMEPQTGFLKSTVVWVASHHRRVPQERITREVLDKAVEQVKERHGAQEFPNMRRSFVGRLLEERNAFVN